MLDLSLPCRRSNIQGFIALAAPLAGAVRAIGVRAAGVGMDTSDRSVLGDVATWFNVFLQNILYAGTMGLPSPVMLFPYEHAFGADWVSGGKHCLMVDCLPCLEACVECSKNASLY